MSKRITNAETIRILDLGLQIPPNVAEAAYRKLYEIENEYMECRKAVVQEPTEASKRTNKRKEN